MKKHIIPTFLLTLLSFPSFAAWQNTSGTVTGITTYASRNTILISLSVAGKATDCSDSSVFAISQDLTPEARNRMYSMLLAAQASGSQVTLTYSDVGGCEAWDSNTAAYRTIIRAGISK